MFQWLLRKYNGVPHFPKERLKQLKKHAQKHKIPISNFFIWDLALTHISFIENVTAVSYERLEFLGDSVLGLCLASVFFEDYPNLSEGKMSMLKSNLANEQTLAVIGRELELLEIVKLGKGEKLNDRRAQEKVLCDLFESTLAVIFLSHGFQKSQQFVRNLFQSHMNAIFLEGVKDFKTKLQKISVKVYKKYPMYTVISTEGPEHGKIFTIQGIIGPFDALGKGRSKKEAEQIVAQNILEKIEIYIEKDMNSLLAKSFMNND